VTGSRDATTVPGQALYLLNYTFIRQQALNLAERLLKDKKTQDELRIQTAYRLTLGRLASEKEIARAKAFLDEYESDYRNVAASSPKKKPTEPKKSPNPQKAKDPPANPDEADQTGEPIVEGDVHPKDARTAAWMAFTQALLGSAEFRYLR
jgi:hypothetical protein